MSARTILVIGTAMKRGEPGKTKWLAYHQRGIKLDPAKLDVTGHAHSNVWQNSTTMCVCERREMHAIRDGKGIYVKGKVYTWLLEDKK